MNYRVWIHQRGRSVRAALPSFSATTREEADELAQAAAGSYAFAVASPLPPPSDEKQTPPTPSGRAS